MELGNAPIGQYRSHDPPKNFALKVRLWRVTSGSIVPAVRHQSVPVLRQDEGTEVAREALEMVERNQDERQEEELIIHWQEKLFCEREIAFYDNPLNCVSALDQKYSDDIRQVAAGNGRKNKRIFTYVDADCHRVDADGGIFGEAANYMTNSGDERQTFLVEKMAGLNLMTVGRRNLSATDQRSKIVEEIPSKHVLDSHVITTPSRIMYIMADLSPDKSVSTRNDEFVLCVIKIDANGQIVVKPDMSRDIPYRIETLREAKEIFEFTLKDTSQEMSKTEKEQESKLLGELYDRHAEVMASQTGMELYPLPAVDELIYYVFGEIVCAKNFDNDDLFVEFFVDLPRNWYSMKKTLSWTTQKCSQNARDIVHFSYPFELQLVYKSPEDGSDHSHCRPRNWDNAEPFVPWPTLFFEVASTDSWQRYRKEGYGFANLPNTAGCHMLEIPTWRPYGNGASQQMRRFFTGGAPELEDNLFVKFPTESEGSHLSKFGFKTVSTGLLTIRLYSILQYKTTGTVKQGRSKARVMMAMESLANVLDTFHKAKKRMLAAKATLPVIT